MFLTIYLAGMVVAFFGPLPPLSCPDIADTYEQKIETGFGQHIYGLADNTGTIRRATDYSVTCETEKPILK